MVCFLFLQSYEERSLEFEIAVLNWSRKQKDPLKIVLAS